jgi:hypothetical protein
MDMEIENIMNSRRSILNQQEYVPSLFEQPDEIQMLINKIVEGKDNSVNSVNSVNTAEESKTSQYSKTQNVNININTVNVYIK